MGSFNLLAHFSSFLSFLSPNVFFNISSAALNGVKQFLNDYHNIGPVFAPCYQEYMGSNCDFVGLVKGEIYQKNCSLAD
jgi:hypothetical protein